MHCLPLEISSNQRAAPCALSDTEVASTLLLSGATAAANADEPPCLRPLRIPRLTSSALSKRRRAFSRTSTPRRVAALLMWQFGGGWRHRHACVAGSLAASLPIRQRSLPLRLFMLHEPQPYSMCHLHSPLRPASPAGNAKLPAELQQPAATKYRLYTAPAQPEKPRARTVRSVWNAFELR